MRRARRPADAGNMRHGLISLLTVVVTLSLATAAVLTVSTSYAMSSLAQRQATMTQEGYVAERCAQGLLARLDAQLITARHAGETGDQVLGRLEEDMDAMLDASCVPDVRATCERSGNVFVCTFTTQNGRVLTTTISIGDDLTYDVEGWQLTTITDADNDTGDTLWTGSTAGE